MVFNLQLCLQKMMFLHNWFNNNIMIGFFFS